MNGRFFTASVSSVPSTMVRRIIFVVLVGMFLCADLSFAQSVGVQPDAQFGDVDPRRMSRTYPNVSHKEIFERFPSMDSIILEFKKGEPSFITLFSSDSSIGNDWRRGVEYVDLAFEGDLYRMKEHYSINEFPRLPREEIRYMNTLLTREDDRLAAFINDGLVTYTFVSRPPVYYAVYKEDVGQLVNTLGWHCRSSNFEMAGDSLLIFQGIVYLDGSLEQIDLVAGTASAFSDFVKGFLSSQEGAWHPMHKDGRPLRSLVDISVHVGADCKLTFSATGRGRILKIKDVKNKSQLFY